MYFQDQTFSLTAEGKLIYDPTEQCAVINKDKPLALCEFRINQRIYFNELEGGGGGCISM